MEHGHPGSITSVHAASAELAFEQMVLPVKQSRGGQEMARSDIKNLLYLLVDVVIQFGVEHHERFVKEIWVATPSASAGSTGRPRAERRGGRRALQAAFVGVVVLIGSPVCRRVRAALVPAS